MGTGMGWIMYPFVMFVAACLIGKWLKLLGGNDGD